MSEHNLITAVFIRRVDNGFVLKAHDAERNTVTEQAHADLEDALDAIGALAWSGERGRDRS